MSESDAALVRSALAGQKLATRILEARLRPVLFGWISRYLRLFGRAEPDLIADLVQETWLSLLTPPPVLGQWYPDGKRLENFVGQQARWIARAYLRKNLSDKRGGRWLQEDILLLEATADPTDLEHDADQRRQWANFADFLRQQINHPTGLLVYKLIYEDFHEPDEAAQLMGVKRQVVYNWQNTFRKLAQEFAERP